MVPIKNRSMKTLCLILLFLLSPLLYAFEIPKRLDAEDRREVSRILGLNTSGKILSNPYPLGGYSGFELGLALEVINIDDLSRLGCQTGDAGCPTQTRSDAEELRYPRISIGKGLYENIDVFLNFIPPFENGMSDFGGMLRWSFFHAKFLPINLSLLVHANRMNLKDSLVTENFGSEILAGINVNNFSLYFGGGFVRNESRFTGGDSGAGVIAPTDPALTSSSNSVSESLHSSHSLVGISLHFDNVFTAFQIDRYRDAVMSAKLGTRF